MRKSRWGKNFVVEDECNGGGWLSWRVDENVMQKETEIERLE